MMYWYCRRCAGMQPFMSISGQTDLRMQAAIFALGTLIWAFLTTNHGNALITGEDTLPQTRTKVTCTTMPLRKKIRKR